MKRGRKLGQTGYIGISIKDLVEKFTPDTIVPIRTSFARQVFPDKIVIIKPNTLPSTEIIKTDLTVKDLDDRIEFKIIN